ncbi:hypothetical protein AAVH_19084 [Aphelenchoides avenae]|nr:hypothetical protein AAVH_19084 [Aphelenchus avenae]
MFEIQLSKEASMDLCKRVSPQIEKQARWMLDVMRSGDLTQGSPRRLVKLKKVWASSVDQGRNAHRILWSRKKLLVTVHRVVGHDEYERLY